MATVQHLQLKIALDAFLLQSVASLPTEQELSKQLSFSADFEFKMQRLIRQARKQSTRKQSYIRNNQAGQNSRYSSRASKRLLLAAIIMSVLISVMSITAAREAVFGFFVRVFQTFSTIIFNEGASSQTQTPETTGAENSNQAGGLPSMLPAGYELADSLLTAGFWQVYYVNPEGDELIFERQLSDTLQVMIDTEDIQIENLMVSQFPGLYYSNKGVQNLIWQADRFVYTISGKVTKNELINMAKSTN